MKGLAKFFLQNRALSWLLLVLILGGGIFSYYNMGKLEDAPFTISRQWSLPLIRGLLLWRCNNR